MRTDVRTDKHLDLDLMILTDRDCESAKWIKNVNNNNNIYTQTRVTKFKTSTFSVA